MGSSGSKAKITQDITNNTLNLNDIETVNKNIMNIGVEALVKNAMNCSSTVNQNNLCNFNDLTVQGDFNLNANQSNTAKINFSCIQESKAQSDMSTAMINEIMNNVASLSNTTAGTKLNAIADSSNTTGSGSTGGTSSSSVSGIVTNNITNATYNKIQNIYEQNLKNNFTAETVSNCIGKTTQNNALSASGVSIQGNANIGCIQTNSLEQIQNCKQLSDALNKTAQQTAQELGLTTITDNTSATTTDASASATSKNVSTGPIEEIGNAVSQVLDSVIGILGLGALFSPSGLCLCILFLCAICVIIVVVINLMGGSSDTSNLNGLNETTYDGLTSGIYDETTYNPITSSNINDKL
jgi:hypothetical protein